MPSSVDKEDFPPAPPVRPEDYECCNSGCDPCIFDLYAQDMERYLAQLEEWKRKQAAGKGGL